jgi:PEP-CTERM motif
VFCIEDTAYFSPGNPYQVILSNAAVDGTTVGGNSSGAVATAGPDMNGNGATHNLLSDSTQWLYQQFAQGSLATIEPLYSYNNSASANSLQEALWWLQGQISDAVLSTDPLAMQLVFDSAGQMPNSDGSVLVAQLWTSVSLNPSGPPTGFGPAQDQLIYLPTENIPEPTSFVLAFFGLIGLVAWSWRRNR